MKKPLPLNKLLNLLTLFICLATSPLQAQEMNVQIIGVVDGDTVLVLDEHKTSQFKVRLDQIDAPEKAQPYGQKAKQFLSSLIYKKRVSLLKKGQDRYNRTIGEITLNGKNVNLLMVQEGYAWAYHKYVTNPEYTKAERKAMQQRKGLWKDKNPIPPWQWRRTSK